MRPAGRLFTIAALCIALPPMPALSADVTYEVVELPNAGGYYSSAVVVNDRGHALVEMYGDYGAEGRLYWSKETGYKPMTFNGKWITPGPMNNHDHVAGVTDAGLGVVWSPHGIVAKFSAPPGYKNLFPSFIRDDGRIFGTLSESETGIHHAFHVSSDGQVVVDHPGKPTCAIAAGSHRGAVVAVLDSPTASCYCYEPHSDYLLRHGQSHRIAVDGIDPMCVFAMDDQGDVLIADVDHADLPGLWSEADGYVPLGINVGIGNIAGVADGGIVAANGGLGKLGKKWRAFLWDRQSGATAVEDMVESKEQVASLKIYDISAHGVLGGGNFRYPIILLPSHWARTDGADTGVGGATP